MDNLLLSSYKKGGMTDKSVEVTQIIPTSIKPLRIEEWQLAAIDFHVCSVIGLHTI